MSYSGRALPDKGPFILFLGNLSYDLTEEHVTKAFAHCEAGTPLLNPRLLHPGVGRPCMCSGRAPRAQVTNVRLARHMDTGKLRAVFVEVADRPSLERGLKMDGEASSAPKAPSLLRGASLTPVAR